MQTKIYCSCDSLVSRGIDLLSWNCYNCEEISKNNVTCIKSTNGILMDLSDFPQFDQLKRVMMDNNNIVCIEDLMNCSETLTELSLSNNHLIDISCLSSAVNLEIMNLNYNGIKCLPASVFKTLARLQVLSIANNNIDSLESLSLATNLVELFASNNNIFNLREIFFLKKLNYLTILDLHGNPISRDESHYRLFAIYHLRAIKIFDTVFIEPTELTVAKEMFGGLLTKDFLADQLNTVDFSSIRVLDFPQFSLQTIDLGDPSLFSNLVSINLEHNNLSTFSGLTHLSNLKTLCLNYNHIEGLLMRMKGRKSAHFEMTSHQYSDGTKGVVLQSLEVLHLGYNGIRDLSALHLHLLPSLRALFLQGNEITLMSGLAGCTKLEELVLDRNRIRFVNESSFLGLVNLSELHLEENRLRSLSNFACLSNLRRLFLGMNHLQEICEIERLSPLMKLIEISLAQNNLAKRNTHKLVLLHHLPGLQVIDGSYISDNDRNRAEIYFFEQAQFNPNTLFHNSPDSSNLVATGLNQTKHSKPAGNQFIEAHENNASENFDE